MDNHLDQIIVPQTYENSSYFKSFEYKQVFNTRLQRIQKSQNVYGNLFQRLNVIVDELKEKYANFGFNEGGQSSGASSPSELQQHSDLSVTSSVENLVKRKRKLSDDDTDYNETDSENNTTEPLSKHIDNEFPKFIDGEHPFVIIGPNGTQVDASLFDGVCWTSPATATRSLLMLIFSNTVLATHTLTGKPSPAFYGRERPLKMQLDRLKTADIIHCVLAKVGGTEREIRSAITTKCADTAKKYKRQLQKKILQDVNEGEDYGQTKLF